jgi:hypothetical protein
MSFAINSPDVRDCGVVLASLEEAIEEVAAEAVRDPGFVEAGRSSRQVTFNETGNESSLHKLATRVADAHLDLALRPGSVAVISTVVDAEAYRAHTRDSKAATNWHQDFVQTPEGFFFPSLDRTRLVVPMSKGPIYAVGELTVADATQINPVSPPQLSDKEAALAAGPTVTGADGVLMKSEADPIGGTIYEAKPNRVYVMPPTTVHKSHPDLPEGRIFLLIDAA